MTEEDIRTTLARHDERYRALVSKVDTNKRETDTDMARLERKMDTFVGREIVSRVEKKLDSVSGNLMYIALGLILTIIGAVVSAIMGGAI